MAETTPSLPRWDMSVVYPGVESPEFDRDFRRLANEVADLGALKDARRSSRPTPSPRWPSCERAPT